MPEPSIYAFWACRPIDEDLPSSSKTTRYFGISLVLLGTLGLLTALGIPTMLVINEEYVMNDQTTSLYNGFFLNCIDFPEALKQFGQTDTCKFNLMPVKNKFLPDDMNACRYGEGKKGFTVQKQFNLYTRANIFAIVSVVAAFATIFTTYLRGSGSVRSARASFATSFSCGVTGSVAIILYYIAINPCDQDICTAMNNSAGVDFLVTCWALSPVGQIIAMLMVFVGGCCAQRWAASPYAIVVGADANANQAAITAEVVQPEESYESGVYPRAIAAEYQIYEGNPVNASS